jgi:hypothetical protein
MHYGLQKNASSEDHLSPEEQYLKLVTMAQQEL